MHYIDLSGLQRVADFAECDDVGPASRGFTRNLSASGIAPDPAEKRHSGIVQPARRNDGSTCSAIGLI